MTTINYPLQMQQAQKAAQNVLILAPEEALKGGWHKKALPGTLSQIVERLRQGQKAGPGGRLISTLPEKGFKKVALGLLPDRGSRHNSPTRTEAVRTCMKRAGLGSGRKLVVSFVDDASHIPAVLAGIWRNLPLFNAKSQTARKTFPLSFMALDHEGRVAKVPPAARQREKAGRWAAWMVDTPTQELDTAVFVRRARSFLKTLPHVTTKLVGPAALQKEKLHGIHAVGRAAAVGPRLLIAEYRPPRPRRTVVLVGKGVVYDTGGLSIKTQGLMRTMKADMGGAAAVMGALFVLAKTASLDRVVALAPLAENAVGPASYRPDDILTLHSGRTVEIDNTDAEGRLLLADAVSFGARRFKPALLVDIATLTGAQLISTGLLHAAVVSNREGLEQRVVQAGRTSGDLAHPLPFAPEFYQAEFKSRVADMKNSVKNRMNAQSSCAAQFVYRHIDDLDLPWLHVDMAGPCHREGRGTGFGVGLLSELVASIQEDDLKV